MGGLLGVERRGLSLLVAAVGISMFGDLLAYVPIALHLQETTGSGIVVAVMFVAMQRCRFVLARAVVHERVKSRAEDLAEIAFERLERGMSVSHLSIINECACES